MLSETRFNIANIIFSVKANKSQPSEWLRLEYARYLIDKSPDIKVSFYYSTKAPQSTRNRLLTQPYQLYGNRAKSEFKVYTKGNYIGVADVLRLLASIALAKTGGFLLHSCGVVMDDGAYLFSGQSGSGKTTIARLNNGYTLLSDETTAIAKKSRHYYTYATPFFGDFGKITSNANAKLKGVLFLKKSSRFSHKQLKPAFAATRFLENIFFPGKELGYNIDIVFDSAIDVANKVPCYELEFAPDGRIWKYIKEKISPGGR